LNGLRACWPINGMLLLQLSCTLEWAAWDLLNAVATLDDGPPGLHWFLPGRCNGGLPIVGYAAATFCFIHGLLQQC
ncbi:hypothetical protein Dimus_020697, partial [Dionaea muscipula]